MACVDGSCSRQRGPVCGGGWAAECAKLGVVDENAKNRVEPYTNPRTGLIDSVHFLE